MRCYDLLAEFWYNNIPIEWGLTRKRDEIRFVFQVNMHSELIENLLTMSRLRILQYCNLLQLKEIGNFLKTTIRYEYLCFFYIVNIHINNNINLLKCDDLITIL